MQKVGAVRRKPSVLFVCGLMTVSIPSSWKKRMQHQIDVQGLKGKGKMMLQANYKKKCKGPLIVSIVLIIGVLAYCK